MAESDGVAGVDLRGLLDEAISKIEPLLRSATAMQAEQSTCVPWCPICKAATVVKGQDQDLLASLTAQGGALLNVLKDAVSGLNGSTSPKHAASATENPTPTTEFTEIPVTIKP